MDDRTLVREQAAALQAAFDAGMTWIRQGPDDPHPVEEHEPIAPGLLPDYVFSVRRFRGRPCVVVEFALIGGPPGLRWLHRFEPPRWHDPLPGACLMSFQEGVECGWIGRSLSRVPAGTSPVWTDFSWGHPSGRWSEALGLLGVGELEQATAVLREGDFEAGRHMQADQIDELALADAATARELRDRIMQTLRERIRLTREADRAATAAFMQQHRSPDGRWSPAWSTIRHG